MLRDVGIRRHETDSPESQGNIVSPSPKNYPPVTISNGDGLVIKGDSAPVATDGATAEECVLEVAHDMPRPRKIR